MLNDQRVEPGALHPRRWLLPAPLGLRFSGGRGVGSPGFSGLLPKIAMKNAIKIQNNPIPLICNSPIRPILWYPNMYVSWIIFIYIIIYIYIWNWSSYIYMHMYIYIHGFRDPYIEWREDFMVRTHVWIFLNMCFDPLNERMGVSNTATLLEYRPFIQ